MVTYFNKKDMISFGNYLFSNERRKRKESAYNEAIRQGSKNPVQVGDTLKMITQEDFLHWKEGVENKPVGSVVPTFEFTTTGNVGIGTHSKS